MINIKSSREIEIMRRSGKITSKTLVRLMEAARPGITTRELDRIADESIRSMGGVPTFIGYNGYPATACFWTATCCRSTSARRSKATSRTPRSPSRSAP
jgi:methionine aminopeptidase